MIPDMHRAVLSQRYAPPAFFRFAGHPLRWRLLSELARSDRQVRELCGCSAQPQNLVSYHLGRLRTAQLVSTRRSSADARDAYYSVDLARCGELLAAAGGLLHPGLRLVPPPIEYSAAADGQSARVLFLCTGNSARSQMAEALLAAPFTWRGRGVQCRQPSENPPPAGGARHAQAGHRSPRSPHQAPAGVRDAAVRLRHHVCAIAFERCVPSSPAHPRTIHWSMADPALEGAAAFERTAVELEMRIRFLLYVIREKRRYKRDDSRHRHRQRPLHGRRRSRRHRVLHDAPRLRGSDKRGASIRRRQARQSAPAPEWPDQLGWTTHARRPSSLARAGGTAFICSSTTSKPRSTVCAAPE